MITLIINTSVVAWHKELSTPGSDEPAPASRVSFAQDLRQGKSFINKKESSMELLKAKRNLEFDAWCEVCLLTLLNAISPRVVFFSVKRTEKEKKKKRKKRKRNEKEKEKKERKEKID